MLPATRRQAEVVEAIGQGLAGNSDLETVAYREIRQALPTGLMMLREEDLLLAAVQCPPAGDPAFQCSSYRIGNSILAELVLERLEDRDGNDTVDLEQLLYTWPRSEEHTSELQSLMRTSYAVFCLKKKKQNNNTHAKRKHIQT